MSKVKEGCNCGNKDSFDREEVYRISVASPDKSEKVSYKTCTACGAKEEKIIKEE